MCSILIPKVTIICLTYNHERYIARAIDSFLMQKTNFPFEIVIHDDASTDGTTDIIKEYHNRYPELIKPIFEKENQFSKKIDIIYSKNLLNKILGKYVSLCEGDDYWIDENKLQIQADYMDSHLDVSICFHPVEVVWENNVKPLRIFPQRILKRDLNLRNLLKSNFIQTNSVMYRWCVKSEMNPGWLLPGDWYLHLLHARVGKIAFIPKVMSVYYRNKNGIWSSLDQDEFYLKNGFSFIRFYQVVEKKFLCNHENAIKDLVYNMTCSALRKSDICTLQILIANYGAYLEDFNIANSLLIKKYKKQNRLLKNYSCVISIFTLIAIICFFL